MNNDTQKSFVSYAQLGEDAVLFQALGHIKHGFYIDIGAQDPVRDSVTKAFYELGWRGINVEPIEHWFDLMVQDRPEDVNLKLAVGSKKGTLKLYELPDTGLSTAIPEYAKRHKERGFCMSEIEVELTTLNDICADNDVSTIHFLKVDAEGSEKEVLLGTDFTKIRPWIIIMEATEPLTEVPTWQEWEEILLNAGFELVRTDGLNRFYVASEHQDIKDKLQMN